MKRAAAIAALSAVLATAAPAAGHGSITPFRIGPGSPAYWSRVAGPVFAGNSIVWGRATRAGYEIVVQRGRHSRRRTIAFDGVSHYRDYETRLSASPTRIGLSLGVTGCRSEAWCENDIWAPVFDAAVTAPLAGPFSTLAKGCATWSEGAESGRPPEPVDVSGDVVAYGDCERTVHVRDLAPDGEGAGRDYPPGDDVRVAGDFVAVQRGDEVTVSNWRTGADLFTVDAPYGFDVAADGTVVYGMPEVEHVAWSSPVAPAPHVIPGATTYVTAFAGGRIADSKDLDPGVRFTVRNLDGSEVASAITRGSIGSPDYDGRRLAWFEQPCQAGWLVVWDGHGKRPKPPGGQCPFPRLVPRSVHLGKKGRLRARLACPRDRRLGCVAYVGARKPGTGGLGLAHHFRSEPGETSGARIGDRQNVCRDRYGRLRTQVVIRVYQRGDMGRPWTPARWWDRASTVRVRGGGVSAPRCAA